MIILPIVSKGFSNLDYYLLPTKKEANFMFKNVCVGDVKGKEGECKGNTPVVPIFGVK